MSATNKDQLKKHHAKTHGLRKIREYMIWCNMKQRCYNTKNTNYFKYGAVGIKMCERWENSFEEFFKDMGKAPSIHHQVDRKNNSLGYSKSNCRWATSKEQNRNRADNVYYTFKGERKCMSEWAEIYNLKTITLFCRLKRYGWPLEKALLTPSKSTRKRQALGGE